MFTHDPYMAKAVEYLVGLASLPLFVLFWRFVNGEPFGAMEHVRAWSGQLAEWFNVPDEVFLHPGHGWARRESPGVVAVGMDDFAQQLVGPLEAIALPQPGTRVEAGRAAWRVSADGRSVDMLAPVSGTVLAVNPAVAGNAHLANDDPYGRGWLFKVKVPRLAPAFTGLMQGTAARKFMDEVSTRLSASMSPELGALCQDGGMPVHGIARGIDPERWDEVARRFLVS